MPLLLPHFPLHPFQPTPPPPTAWSASLVLQINWLGTSYQTMGRSEERLKQKKKPQIYRLSIKLLKDLRNSNESDVGKGRGCQRPWQEGLTRTINLNQRQGGMGGSILSGWGNVMKRFQPRLKKEARPPRHGGGGRGGGLGAANKEWKSSRLWGWERGESLASRGQQQRHRNTFLAWWEGGGWLALKPLCKGSSKDLLAVCRIQNAN